MPLPEKIHVKLSSEAAEYVALTPVVVRELATVELLEHIVSAVGLDVARVASILKRGTLVSGASRFRWQGWEATLDEIGQALATLSGPEPARTLDLGKCTRIALCGPAVRIEIALADAARKRMFRRKSFLDAVLEIAGAPAYSTYLYRERSDVFRAALDEEMRARVKKEAELLPHDSLHRQIHAAHIETVELIVSR